jgi:hypothetical protein
MIVDSDTALQEAIGEIRALYAQYRYLTVTVKHGKHRGLPINKLSHTWYCQISRELREMTPIQAKAFCKLHYGVPIMRAECAVFRENYDTRIKAGFTYEQKLIIMESFPVTSLMTNPQIKQYLEAVQAGYAGKVALEFPKDEHEKLTQ